MHGTFIDLGVIIEDAWVIIDPGVAIRIPGSSLVDVQVSD